VSALIGIVVSVVLLVAPCVVAGTIDLEEEDACSDEAE
jgi:hypothetical protein